MEIHENIKRIRKQKNISQKELAHRLNISPQNLAQYESGKRKPKIETVNRIASALGVNIIDLMEEFTIDRYKTTSEYQQLEKTVNAENGIIALLTDIYGKVEDKDIEGSYGSGHYYLVGEGKNQFILYDGDINTLYESTKAAIPALVERMKDSRPEEEVISEYLKELNSPELLDKIPEKYT